LVLLHVNLWPLLWPIGFLHHPSLIPWRSGSQTSVHSSSSTSWATMGHTRACLRSRVFRSPASPLRPREDVRIIILTSVCPSRPPAWAGHRVPHRRPKAVPENHTSRRGPRGRPCGFMGFLRPFGAVRQARVLVRGTSRLATRVFLLGLWIRGVALVSFSRLIISNDNRDQWPPRLSKISHSCRFATPAKHEISSQGRQD